MSHEAFAGISVVDGDLFCVYRTADGHNPDTGSPRGTIVGTFSTDGGDTWGTPATVVDDTVNQYDARDPVALTLANGDVLVPHFLLNNTETIAIPQVARSTDDAATWSIVALTNSFTDIAYFGGGCVQLANGDVLACTYGLDTGDADTSVRVSRSTDNGASWSALAQIADGEGDNRNYNETALVQLANGDVLCVIREENGGIFYTSTSTDNGATWSTPTSIGFSSSGRPILLRPTGSTLVLAYRNLNYNQNQCVRYSTDDGATWSNFAFCYQGAMTGTDFRMIYGQMCTFGGQIAWAFGMEGNGTVLGGNETDAAVKFIYLVDDGAAVL